ncbi:MAG TPA: hypothetical protein EYN78_01405, partial [Candidatus Poseidoniales archaeon]|nr:hypothetical protein [Candidatus Poseidoniales archaeon]
MSGGLLEKAQSQDNEAVVTPDEGVTAAVEDVEETSGGGLLERAAFNDGEINQHMSKGKVLAGFATLIMLFSMYGLFNLASMFNGTALAGFSGLIILFTALVALGLGSMAYRELVNEGNPLAKVQWGALLVGWLILSLGPYVGGMNFSGSLAVTNVTHDEASNSLTFEFRQTSGLFGSAGSSDTLDVRVTQNGVDVWTSTVESVEGSNGLGSFSINISDFYSSNAFQVTGKKISIQGDDGNSYNPESTEVPYRLHASKSGLREGTIVLDSRTLTRHVDDADGAMTGVIDNCESCKDLLGVVLDVWVGTGNADFDSDIPPAAVQGDYTILGEVFDPDGTLTFTYPLVTVDGTIASWDNTDGFGSGNGVVGDYSSQLNLPGTTTDGDPLGREYIERNDILSDYGCYEFRVTVTMTEEWASELDSTIAVEEFTFERGMNSDED